MSFEERYQDLHRRTKQKLEQPCDNEADLETHVRLTQHDYLHKEEGHTSHCACRQVWGGEDCTCGKDARQAAEKAAQDTRPICSGDEACGRWGCPHGEPHEDDETCSQQEHRCAALEKTVICIPRNSTHKRGEAPA